MMYATNATIHSTYWADGDCEDTEYEFLIANTLEELYEKMATLKAERDEGYEYSDSWTGRPAYGTETTFGEIYKIETTLPFDSDALENTNAWAKFMEEQRNLEAQKQARIRKEQKENEERERAQYERLRSKFGE